MPVDADLADTGLGSVGTEDSTDTLALVLPRGLPRIVGRVVGSDHGEETHTDGRGGGEGTHEFEEFWFELLHRSPCALHDGRGGKVYDPSKLVLLVSHDGPPLVLVVMAWPS